MEIKTLPRGEKMIPYCRDMKIGDSVLIPFRRYSQSCIKFAAHDLKRKGIGEYTVSTRGRLTDAKVTRLR